MTTNLSGGSPGARAAAPPRPPRLLPRFPIRSSPECRSPATRRCGLPDRSRSLNPTPGYGTGAYGSGYAQYLRRCPTGLNRFRRRPANRPLLRLRAPWTIRRPAQPELLLRLKPHLRWRRWVLNDSGGAGSGLREAERVLRQQHRMRMHPAQAPLFRRPALSHRERWPQLQEAPALRPCDAAPGSAVRQREQWEHRPRRPALPERCRHRKVQVRLLRPRTRRLRLSLEWPWAYGCGSGEPFWAWLRRRLQRQRRVLPDFLLGSSRPTGLREPMRRGNPIRQTML